MKIKILLFVNLVLIGTAIGLYINRSTDPGAAAAVTGTPGPPAIPPETAAPWNETASNVSPSTVDGIESNTVPKTVPQTNTKMNAHGQYRPAAAMEKDFAPARSLF
jgi:hypothetical protein